MNIGINAQLAAGTRSGIGNYIYYLTQSLGEVDSSNQYVLFTNGKANLHADKFNNVKQINVSLKAFKSWARILYEQFFLPGDIHKNRVEIMHFPDYALPVLFNTGPSVITVHDLSFKLFPETFSWGKLFTKKLLIKPSLKKADKIIADSHNTKNDLMDLYQVPAEKIEVIHIGVDTERFKPIESTIVWQTLYAKYGLKSGYILYVGTLEPRKNITGLIKAFKRLKQKHDIQQKLVIAGSKGWLYNDIFRMIEQDNLKHDVILTGYVREEDLPLLYNGAEVFMFPSLYEGFGLPPLEAMACGTPVIASNVSSLPEVVGEAGILITPDDIDGIADAMFRMITDKELAKELSLKGLQRARHFTWEETARKTLAVYEEVYSKQQDVRKRR